MDDFEILLNSFSIVYLLFSVIIFSGREDSSKLWIGRPTVNTKNLMKWNKLCDIKKKEIISSKRLSETSRREFEER